MGAHEVECRAHPHIFRRFRQFTGPQLLIRHGGDFDLDVDTVEQWAPGFRKSVLGRQILSPLDLERVFGLAGGDIMHGNMSLDQLWSARPILGNAAYRGPILAAALPHGTATWQRAAEPAAAR